MGEKKKIRPTGTFKPSSQKKQQGRQRQKQLMQVPRELRETKEEGPIARVGSGAEHEFMKRAARIFVKGQIIPTREEIKTVATALQTYAKCAKHTGYWTPYWEVYKHLMSESEFTRSKERACKHAELLSRPETIECILQLTREEYETVLFLTSIGWKRPYEKSEEAIERLQKTIECALKFKEIEGAASTVLSALSPAVSSEFFRGPAYYGLLHLMEGPVLSCVLKFPKEEERARILAFHLSELVIEVARFCGEEESKEIIERVARLASKFKHQPGEVLQVMSSLHAYVHHQVYRGLEGTRSLLYSETALFERIVSSAVSVEEAVERAKRLAE